MNFRFGKEPWRPGSLQRLLLASVGATALACVSLVYWGSNLRSSSVDAASSPLLSAVAEARMVGTAIATMPGAREDLDETWDSAVRQIVAEASNVDDLALTAAVSELLASSDKSTVARLSALNGVEQEAKLHSIAAGLASRRQSTRMALYVAFGSMLFAAAGFLALRCGLERAATERTVLDEILPAGHESDGLATRASRLTGRASSLVERQSSLVSERLGLVRLLSDLEENEARLAAEARLHRDEIERLQVSQMRDELTGVLNFKYFLMRLDEALDDFIERQHPFCLLALDLDDFKGINDGYGHHVGDAALRAMGRLLGDEALEGEIVFRKSGDEFYVLMPRASAAEAVSRAETLLNLINGHEVTYQSIDETYRVHLATSIGVLHCEQVDKQLLSSLKRDQLLSETYGFADAALFKAKYSGKGCARIYTTGLTVVDVNPKEFPPDFDSLHRGLKARYPLLDSETRDEFNRHLAAARRLLSGPRATEDHPA
ncbi:MAG: GGDEF domain-containing protein [Acidobacteria bacterium]|nr:GGDEF domain-containing protein [Acidobacteriota bacterium]